MFKRFLNRLLKSLFVGCLCAVQVPAYAVDFSNGITNTVDTDIQPQGIRIFDGAGGTTTTVNVQSGADYNGLFSYDTSIANIYDGSDSTQDINALNDSMVNIFGGTMVGADADDNAYLSISGGTLTRAGRVVGGFGDSTIDITNGTFTGSDISVIGLSNASINIGGGNFTGDIRSEDDSSIWVRGGDIPSVVSIDRGTLTLVGSSFSIPSLGGSVSLATPYVIDFTLNDTITGVLADGSSLNADIFNAGTIGSRIILTSVPVPPAVYLFVSGLIFLGANIRKKGHSLDRAH